jgi:cyclophilin family peptidyl-prolyl cis-trans isomerase
MRSLLALALVSSLACSRSPKNDATGGEGGVPKDARASASAREELTRSVLRAENTRRAEDVAPEARTSRDVILRRASARALARIASEASLAGLLQHLADEDPEVVAWAAYGLGYACKGHEDTNVSALAARAASLKPGAFETPPRGGVEPSTAIARAIGRCAGPHSEETLVAMLGASRAALLGLGDLAVRTSSLGEAAVAALLRAADDATHPDALAFYALGRIALDAPTAARVERAAEKALTRPDPARTLVIRALGRAGKQGAASAAALERIVVDKEHFDVGERAEAARALGQLGEPGTTALERAVLALTPDAQDAAGIAALTGLHFSALYTILEQLPADESSSRTRAALTVLASLSLPNAPSASGTRRLSMLRCSAALSLAGADYESPLLARCDSPTSELTQRARLRAIVRRPLTRDRLAAFQALAEHAPLRVREEALEALSNHPEAGEAATRLLASALRSPHAGIVATAAEVLHAHPDRAVIPTATTKKTRRARAEEPLAPVLAEALTTALSTAWPADRFETRIALVEAAAAIRHPEALAAAKRACAESNPVLRERGLRALRTLGSPEATCGVAASPDPAPELDALPIHPTKIVLSTDSTELRLVLEPDLSPVTVARLTSLVRSGFFEGVEAHRVVSGFVVQFGDPEGDGFGGSGTPLRCETSPVPFGPLDVGMALSGRDTGSSQVFVTLSRTPHLDGEYTRIGRAEGDWASVAPGDVFRNVRVVP